MKDQRKLQVNTKQRGANEQREGKECKTRRQAIEELRIRKPRSTKIFMKLAWKFHEATRGKGTLS